MKNFVFLFVFCSFLLACHSNAQKDENNASFRYLKRSAKITQAQGYELDRYGGAGWIGNPNFVSRFKYDTQNLPEDSLIAIMVNAKQNFVSIESALVSMEGENYFVFIVDKWIAEDSLRILSGKAPYKEVKEAYIFSDYEHSKLRKTPDRYSVISYRKITDRNRSEPFNKKTFDVALQEEIISEKDSSIHYLFTVKPEWLSDGKPMAQIGLPYATKDDYDATFPYQHFTLTPKQYDNLLFRKNKK